MLVLAVFAFVNAGYMLIRYARRALESVPWRGGVNRNRVVTILALLGRVVSLAIGLPAALAGIGVSVQLMLGGSINAWWPSMAFYLLHLMTAVHVMCGAFIVGRLDISLGFHGAWWGTTTQHDEEQITRAALVAWLLTGLAAVGILVALP